MCVVLIFPVLKVAEKRNMAVSSLNITQRVLGADRSLQKVLPLAQDITVFHACVSVWMGRWLEVTMLAEVQGCWQWFRQ